MAGKTKLKPALLWAIVPAVVTAMTLAITSYRWQAMAGGFSPANAYWFLRSAPVPNLLFGPIAGLITVFALPMHRRRPVAMVRVHCPKAACTIWQRQGRARSRGRVVQTRVQGPNRIAANGTGRFRVTVPPRIRNLLTRQRSGIVNVYLAVQEDKGNSVRRNVRIGIRR